MEEFSLRQKPSDVNLYSLQPKNKFRHSLLHRESLLLKEGDEVPTNKDTQQNLFNSKAQIEDLLFTKVST